jgi:hypothetical protein
MKTSVIVSVSAFALGAFAHGGVYSYDIDGVTYNGSVAYLSSHALIADMLGAATNGLSHPTTRQTSYNAVGICGRSKTQILRI